MEVFLVEVGSRTTRNGEGGARTALVVAHPGHELRVYGWAMRTRPTVFVLTDGSGRTGVSRLASTTRLLEEISARAGEVYGRFTDRRLYDVLLDRDADVLIELAHELARAFAERGVSTVAGDALEGYNPTHDICRVITSAAVMLARSALGQPIAHVDFALTGRPDTGVARVRGDATWIHLDEREFERKCSAARRYRELAIEVDLAVGADGLGAFRTECLRPAVDLDGDTAALALPPCYETYGEMQVAAGHYDRVLRFHEHFAPVAAAIRTHVAMAGGGRELDGRSCGFS